MKYYMYTFYVRNVFIWNAMCIYLPENGTGIYVQPRKFKVVKMLVELLLIIDVDISYTVTQSLHIYTYLNGFPRW